MSAKYIYGVIVKKEDLFLNLKTKTCDCSNDEQIVIPSNTAHNVIICRKCSQPFWSVEKRPIHGFSEEDLTYKNSRVVPMYYTSSKGFKQTSLSNSQVCLIGKILGEPEYENVVPRKVIDSVLELENHGYDSSLPGPELPNLFLVQFKTVNKLVNN